jgi:ribonuclease HI
MARKLRQYFTVHPIIVVNEAPLSNILNNPSATGRVSLWGIELSPLDIMYEKRKAIKSQVLSDFTAEWLELQNTGPPDLSSVWTMYFDGSKRIQGAGAGVVLISPQGDKLKYVLRMSFPQASNNEAEYKALLHGMKMVKACRATRLKILGDSNLVVQQVMNRCDAVSDNITAYRNLYYYLEGTFDGCEVSHVSRASNEEADNLANIGSQCLPVPPGVFWEEIIERSIKINKNSTTEGQDQHSTTASGAGKRSTAEPKEVMMIEETSMQPYLAYMVNKTLPEDTIEAKRTIRRSKTFVVLQGKLYKKSMMSTHFYSCRHLLGLQVQRFVEQQLVSLKWITQGLSNSGRLEVKAIPLKQPCNYDTESLLCPQHTQYTCQMYRCTSSAKR